MNTAKWLVVVMVLAIPLSAFAAPQGSVLSRSEKVLALHEGTAADRAALETLSKSGLLEKLVNHWRSSTKASQTKASGSFSAFHQKFANACLARDVEQVINYCTLPLGGTEMFTDDWTPISTCSQFEKAFPRIFTPQVGQALINTTPEKQADGSIHLGCCLNEYDEEEGMIMESAVIFVFKPVSDKFRLVNIIFVG